MFNNNSESKFEAEGADNLEKSISNDLFELYIDANFDQPIPQINDNFDDIHSTTLNTPNIDDIIPSIQVDSFLDDLTSTSINTNVISKALDSEPPVEFQGSEDKPLSNTIEGNDNFEEIDMDMETVGETQFVNNKMSDNIQFSSDDRTSHPDKDTSNDSNGLVSNEIQHMSGPDNIEEKSDLEEKNTGCDKKSLKSVRFLDATPNENTRKIQERIENSLPVSEQKISRPKNTSKRRSIQVQIPVHFRSG